MTPPIDSRAFINWTRWITVATIAAAIAVATATLVASGPTLWTTFGAGDLLRGTSNGVFVGSDGVITAGPQLTSRLTSTPSHVWSLAAGADGVVWAGTGGDARLLRLRPGQPEETVATATEAGVFAVAVAGTRTYFATGPEGKVSAIDGAAAPRTILDPQEKYIWALTVDGRGRLWVAAGSPAVLYRVEADGTNKAIYRPAAAHVVSLATDARGNVLAGTESPGRLYRIDANDRVYALLDTEMTEVRAIAPGRDGAIFVAAITRGDDPAPAAGESTSMAMAQPPASSGGSSTPAAPVARRSAIFRIDASGAWDTYWETPDVIYDIAVDRDGAVLAASGPEGRLYRITQPQQAALSSGVDAKQITRIITNPNGGGFMATANPGRVVALGTATTDNASYLSPVRDTHSSSTWGTVRWESTGAVTLFTRSGNTERPDDTWSEWDGPYAKREGELVKSPAARYVQWKAVLGRNTGAASQLTSVTLAYLTRNSRPVVSAVAVLPPGVVFQKPFTADDGAIAGLDDVTADARRPAGDATPPPPPGRRMYQKGLQTITWKADDADGDKLTASIFFRREGEATWHPLKSDWNDTIVVWDTTTVADGRYLIKIVASDAGSNAADRALTGEHESTPVDVDNTPPTLTTELGRQPALHLVVRAHDAQSAIAKLEYSLAGGRWLTVNPVDGVSDSPDERYEIPLASEADATRIMVRATDALQNVVTQPAVVR